jgi:hypothetical protein
MPDPSVHKAENNGPAKDLTERLSSLSNLCIAAFTLVLAVTSIYQGAVIYRQLDAMRKDQRPWLELDALPDTTSTLTAGRPVTCLVHLRNIGKTPARNVEAKIYLDIIDFHREPPLDDVEQNLAHPRAYINTGILFPNSDFKLVTMRPAGGGSPALATESEVTAVREGRAYLAIYGIVNYDDIFNMHHWTKFCEWPSVRGNFQPYHCTNYNNVDDN